jgi:hypothetical protein
MSAHSNLSDYERGIRIPPLDVVVAIERVLAISDQSLRRWHTEALQEAAEDWFFKAVGTTGTQP